MYFVEFYDMANFDINSEYSYTVKHNMEAKILTL